MRREDADGLAALFGGEPLGGGLDGGGEVAGFADTEAGAGDAELEDRVGERMAHRGEAPHGHDDHVADASADPVDKAAGHEQAQRVGHLKCVDDVAVVEFGHADACLERRLGDADDLAIHVVDGCGREEHGADGPAHVPDPFADRRICPGFDWRSRDAVHLVPLTACMPS